MNQQHKENQFLDSLESLFTGTEIDGDSGFANLTRIKKVIYSKDWKDGKPESCDGSSHCLKYYSLEQYEETLKNASYNNDKRPLEINIHDLYSDMDIAESLSNVLGKPIRHRTENTVTFTDGTMEKINIAEMTEAEKQHFISLMKPYLVQ